MTPKTGNLLDFEPFRIWILKQVRVVGLRSLAKQLGVDHSQVSRWCRGYYWDDEPGISHAQCEPHIIRTVHIDIVDRMGIAMGEQDLINRLYPYAESEE